MHTRVKTIMRAQARAHDVRRLTAFRIRRSRRAAKTSLAIIHGKSMVLCEALCSLRVCFCTDFVWVWLLRRSMARSHKLWVSALQSFACAREFSSVGVLCACCVSQATHAGLAPVGGRLIKSYKLLRVCMCVCVCVCSCVQCVRQCEVCTCAHAQVDACT